LINLFLARERRILQTAIQPCVEREPLCNAFGGRRILTTNQHAIFHFSPSAVTVWVWQLMTLCLSQTIKLCRWNVTPSSL